MKTRWAARCTKWALGVGLLLLSGFASAQNLILNPSFETLGQANWTSVLNTAACASWNDSAATPPRTAGANGVFSDQVCPSSQILYQDVTLPATATYTFSIDAGCNVLGGTAFDFCRVDITDTSAGTIVAPTPGVDTLATTSAGVLVPVFAADSTTGSQPQTTITVSAPGAAGLTVRIRMMVQATTGPQNIGIDNLFLAAAFGGAVAVPTLSELSLALLALLLVAGGMAHMQRSDVRRF